MSSDLLYYNKEVFFSLEFKVVWINADPLPYYPIDLRKKSWLDRALKIQVYIVIDVGRNCCQLIFRQNISL